MSKSGDKKKNPIIFILGGIIVVAIVVAAVMFVRIRLLQNQLDLGRKYLEASDYDSAQDSFEKALSIYPTSADAYMGLAETQIGKKHLTEAIATLNTGISKTHSANLEQSKSVIMDQVFSTYVMNSYLVNILPDETIQMTMTNKSEDMGFSTEWSIEDENIASIDENGLVRGINEGTTKIFAKIGNDEWGYQDVTATLIVGIMKTYFDEQGCEYVSPTSKLTAPAFVYQENQDGHRIYDGTLEIPENEAMFSIDSCNVTDPDDNGDITYTIEYSINVPLKFGILANSIESKQAWYYNWQIAPLILCDEYTGLVFSEQDLFGEEGFSYDSYIDWNDFSFHITGNVNGEWTDEAEWQTSYDEETQITWAESPAVGKYTINITVPKEYQGLVLAFDKRGITDYTDPVADENGQIETEYVDTLFFDKAESGEVRKPSDYVFIRVSDIK